MNNPLPVDRFSPADAARRTWPQLIESMLEAVCLVEPEELRIVAANVAAGALLGRTPAELIGLDMLALSATPEDDCFWAEVAEGIGTGILSDSYVTRPGAVAVPVTRRVTRVDPGPGTHLYVVALHDRSGEVAAQRSADAARAELQATLESVSDGVMVVDLAGHISNFNRRFADIWGVCRTRCCCCAPTTRSTTGSACRSPTRAAMCSGCPRSTPIRSPRRPIACCCARAARSSG